MTLRTSKLRALPAIQMAGPRSRRRNFNLPQQVNGKLSLQPRLNHGRMQFLANEQTVSGDRLLELGDTIGGMAGRP
jgi:hypothetical protein